MSLLLPNELLLQIASYLVPQGGSASHAQSCSALSTLSRGSTTLYSLLSPTLYSHLDLSQGQLITLLNCPSSNFDTVKQITLHSLQADFDIDHTKAVAMLNATDSTRVVFPNATTLTLRDTAHSRMAFDPIPMLASLPKLLTVENLILDLKMLSWRLNGLPPLWPKSLRRIEMYCQNWMIPFFVPGIHHVLHLSDTACPFRPTEANPDPDPGDESETFRSHRSLLTAAFRWIAMRMESCALLEEKEDAGLTTWEVRVSRGGKQEVKWAERRVGEMLLEAGVGNGRVDIDENGVVRAGCFKIVVEGQ